MQPKSKAQVYNATCVMCHDDATPHIMTHDAALIILTPLSHGTHFRFTLSTLSLCFSSSSREEVVEDVEEKKEGGGGVLRRDHATASGA
jgi:hypothetical protein